MCSIYYSLPLCLASEANDLVKGINSIPEEDVEEPSQPTPQEGGQQVPSMVYAYTRHNHAWVEGC